MEFENLSDFILFLQEQKLNYDEISNIETYLRKLDANEISEVKDKIIDLTLDEIPEKEIALQNFKDFSKQRVSELSSAVFTTYIAVASSERKQKQSRT